MNEKFEKYLPIGSVVMLKGGKKRVMVAGFLGQTDNKENNQNQIYDYIGCLYPEGIISIKKTILFNHDQIDKIYNLGLADEEEKAFKVKLNEIANKILNPQSKVETETEMLTTSDTNPNSMAS